MAPHWIWQQPDWPNFNWQAERLTPLLRECVQAQGQLMGMASSVGSSFSAQSELDALLQNIVTSSAIEGEQLNVGSVRSSLARRLGLEQVDGDHVSQRSEGLAQLMLDATQHFAKPLTLERLLEWHEWLFPDQETDFAARSIHVGALRGDEPMQVVSGRLDKPTVHFEAPPRLGLEQQLENFLAWFETSQRQEELDPLLRAGIAHFWFVTLHPFDDGNGRLTRTLADLALAQGEAQAIRFYAMSASILEDRTGYYRVLENSQKATTDITLWLEWFLQTLLRSLQQAMARIESVLGKGALLAGAPGVLVNGGADQSAESLAGWRGTRFREWHQCRAVSGCGERIQSDCHSSSERTVGKRLFEASARRWAQYSIPDPLSRRLNTMTC
jgi:Fic family protein